MSTNLAKMMNYPLLGPNGPNSYQSSNGCRHYLRDIVFPGPSGVKWMRPFLNWSFVQPNAPSYASNDSFGAFNFYNTNTTAKTWFGWLDEVIAECNADGILVNLCIGQYHPDWANPGSPAYEPGTQYDPDHNRKPVSQRLPADVDMDSYWAKWIAYVYNRYRTNDFVQGIYNPVGPSASNPYGNPKKAWIAAFECCNEPNYYSWVADDLTACMIAIMFQTVDSLLSFWGHGCGVLGPGTADIGDTYYTNQSGGQGPKNTLSYETFTNDLLDTLQNWRPANYFAWSHHNYRDMRDSTSGSDPATLTRIKKVGTALSTKNWRGGGDRNIWVTEGGYRMALSNDWTFSTAEQNKQAGAIESTWRAFKSYTNAVTFAQYLLNNDPADLYTSGLTDLGYYSMDGFFYPGDPLPGWTTFKTRT